MDPNIAKSLRAPEIDSLIELLQAAFPENEKIKTGVIPLLSNKKSYVKTLLDLWDGRKVPPLSAQEVQQICNLFYRDHPDEEAKFQISYGDVTVRTNKSYIHTFKVTENGTPGTYGLNPFSGSYEQIQYEGDLSFQSLFDFSIDFDVQSKITEPLRISQENYPKRRFNRIF